MYSGKLSFNLNQYFDRNNTRCVIHNEEFKNSYEDKKTQKITQRSIGLTKEMWEDTGPATSSKDFSLASAALTQ